MKKKCREMDKSDLHDVLVRLIISVIMQVQIFHVIKGIIGDIK